LITSDSSPTLPTLNPLAPPQKFEQSTLTVDYLQSEFKKIDTVLQTSTSAEAKRVAGMYRLAGALRASGDVFNDMMAVFQQNSKGLAMQLSDKRPAVLKAACATVIDMWQEIMKALLARKEHGQHFNAFMVLSASIIQQLFTPISSKVAVWV
jgi:hypothetical protein